LRSPSSMARCRRARAGSMSGKSNGPRRQSAVGFRKHSTASGERCSRERRIAATTGEIPHFAAISRSHAWTFSAAFQMAGAVVLGFGAKVGGREEAGRDGECNEGAFMTIFRFQISFYHARPQPKRTKK